VKEVYIGWDQKILGTPTLNHFVFDYYINNKIQILYL